MRSGRATTLLSIAAVALVAACALVFALTSFQQDFAAYWVAGAARRAGLDPYVNNAAAGAKVPWDGSGFRHSRFLYPPLAADLMRPLAALPYRAAKLLFTAGALAAWIAAAALVARGRRVSAAMLGAGALFFPLYLHLERGQIDLLLLPLVLGAWRVKHRPALAGALFAAAATIKPALLGALPAIAALGHRRWAAWTVGAAAAALLATVVVSGPALVREYAGVVLPRAALYGEGGTDAMALHERDLEGLYDGGDGDTQAMDGRSYRYVVAPFDRPASASLPRVLAPESPSWPTSLLPYLLAAGAMIWAGRRVARRRDGDGPADNDDAQLMLFVAALVACVVTSPTGWVMGFVWALPIAPLVLRHPGDRDGAAVVAARDGRGVDHVRAAGAVRRLAGDGGDDACGGGRRHGDRVAARMIVLGTSLLALAIVGVSLARLTAADDESRATTATRAALAAAVVMVGVQAALGAVARLTAAHTLGALAVAAAAVMWASARRRPRPPPVPREPWSAADAAVAAALLALFAERLWHGLHATTFLYDTLSYHLHVPATWLHEARLTIVPAVFGDTSPAYAPANLELWFLLLMAPLRSDYLAGVGQLPLAALAATAIVAAVREAGGGRTAALAAALAFLLVPEVHGQIATAMTDLGLAAFLLASLPFAVRRDVVAAAAALGLAVGTKYAGVALAVPFAAATVMIALRRPRVRSRDALIALVVLVAAGGFWYLRNIALTGNPLYPVAVPGLSLPARYGGAEMRAWEYHLPVGDVGALGELLLGAGIAFTSAAAIALARAWRGLELALVAALVAVFWLVVPYQESRFLFAAFGVAAVAMARTARQAPPLLGWSLLGVALAGGLLQQPAPRALPLVVAALVAAAAHRLWRRLPAHAGARAAPVLAAAAIVALAVAVGAGHGGYQARARGYTVGDDLDGAWAWMEANVHDSGVAYTGTNVAFPLAGRRLGNRVTYVNIAGAPGDRLHDFPPTVRSSAEPAVYRDGGGAARDAGGAARWLDNLRAAGSQVLFVAAMYPIVRRTIDADADGFPVERAWADARPDRFQLRYASPAARIYTLVGP